VTAADTWTDRYEGRAVCPDGHEFTGVWLDSTRAALTCPACSRVFPAIWPGFAVEPETVIVAADDLAALAAITSGDSESNPPEFPPVSVGIESPIGEHGMGVLGGGTRDGAEL
jgi:hypothetical protein